MRIYIAGPISGLLYTDAKQKFAEAEDLLTNIGYQVVSPTRNGLPPESTWEEHIARDIGLLLSCPSVYFLDGWCKSRGASIEYDVAVRADKNIFFESKIVKSMKEIRKISQAVHEVTGVAPDRYNTGSRKRIYFFARVLFSFHCLELGMTADEIAMHLKRDDSSVSYYRKTYHVEKKFNARFREMALDVERRLS